VCLGTRWYGDDRYRFQPAGVCGWMSTSNTTADSQGAAADLGVRLDRILFFDDTLENVEGARAIGIQAVHVQSVDDIEHNLAGFLQ